MRGKNVKVQKRHEKIGRWEDRRSFSFRREELDIRCGSWMRCRKRMRGTEERFKEKGEEIESLHSTFLCELTGLDAQLTGLFWQVSDGPYYHFTAGPLGPCITGHNSTGQARKKRSEMAEKFKEKKITTLDFLSLQLTGSAFSQSLGISCMFSVDRCVLWQRCGRQKIILQFGFAFFRGEMKKYSEKKKKVMFT